jgi:hypothetical protein
MAGPLNIFGGANNKEENIDDRKISYKNLLNLEFSK